MKELSAHVRAKLLEPEQQQKQVARDRHITTLPASICMYVGTAGDVKVALPSLNHKIIDSMLLQ